MSAPQVTAWPRAPIDGVTPLLQPVAHVLIHVKNELPAILAGLSADDLWAEPGGVPSIGFHLAHLAGNIERLFTYAAGHQLSELQRQHLAGEATISHLRPTLTDLLGRLDIVLETSLTQLRRLPPERLLETRDIGLDRGFATVVDLVSSAAEHASRHMGQIVTTATFLRSTRSM
jgi:hypothetical protein